MTDYRQFFDKEFLAAWELDGRDVTVTIEHVTSGEVVGENGRKDKKPILRMAGKKKQFVSNITNCRTIAGMYGKRVEDWVGKRITLYPTMTKAKSGEMVECIRVRPQIPPTAAAKSAPAEEPPEPGSNG